MEGWTPEHNKYLSYLLDDVTGTEEMVKMRQDYCKIEDCIRSINPPSVNIYYTGSKAEGLDLPGSDDDYMFDINNIYDIAVSESIEDLVQSTRANKVLIVTDNVPPAFSLLKIFGPYDQSLRRAMVNMGDNAYLSSQEFLSPLASLKRETRRIQGPSIETWEELAKTSESVDKVPSILCKSWPTAAAEWKDRPRHYGWPSQKDRESIEAFGYHLVPVGHPLSTKRSLEWRLSFSIAERILVWSFNHTQIHCYAILKRILKEFVKTNCSEKHKDVLCSYFIKTFLFWQFEATDPLLWQTTNLAGCLMYLLHQFYICIDTGVLRHYFVPRFNLLHIKLTQDAQTELLYIFGKIEEIGMPLLRQCKSLSGVFSKFCNIREGTQNSELLTEICRRNVLHNDEFAMGLTTVDLLNILPIKQDSIPYETLLASLVRLANQGHLTTFLSDFVIRRLCSLILNYRCYICINERNRSVYFYMKCLDKNIYGTNLASSKLWLATFLLQQGDYYRSLQTIDDVLSSIPPYALYYSGDIRSSDDSKQLYVDTYCTQNSSIIRRAKEAWLTDIFFTHEEYSFLPRGIQVELLYCITNFGVLISPFTYAYYLMVLCYHGLGQYDNRDRALRQLVDTVNDDERCSIVRYHSYNIAGHCMLMAGYVEMARNMFLESAKFTHSRRSPALEKYNSAYEYLSFMWSNVWLGKICDEMLQLSFKEVHDRGTENLFLHLQYGAIYPQKYLSCPSFVSNVVIICL